MIDEIAAGIKNAVERGSSVEEAAQSFINAGYNPQEVREAANILTQGVTSILNPQKQPQPSTSKSRYEKEGIDSRESFFAAENQPQVPISPTEPLSQGREYNFEGPQVTPAYPNPDQLNAKKSKKGWIIFLLVLLLIIIGAAVLVILFKEELLELISSQL